MKSPWSSVQGEPARRVTLPRMINEQRTRVYVCVCCLRKLKMYDSSFSSKNYRSVCWYHLFVCAVGAVLFMFPFSECRRKDSQNLCGSHGLCAMDLDESAPKCFCNTGFSGSSCSKGTRCNGFFPFQWRFFVGDGFCASIN